MWSVLKEFRAGTPGCKAYGAGKSAFWGSPHDWKRSLINEDRSREYSLFGEDRGVVGFRYGGAGKG